MPLKIPAHPLPPECREIWEEVRNLIVLFGQNISRAESCGRECAEWTELGERFTKWLTDTGWAFYPESMPQQVIE